MTPGVYPIPPTELRSEATVYKPYGERVPTVTALQPEGKGRTRERFDPETGPQYLNARTYDPELGMFIQPDWWEVTKPGVGTNRYGYSFGDPVNKMDPGGNEVYDRSVSDKEQKALRSRFDAARDALHSTITAADGIARNRGKATTKAERYLLSRMEKAKQGRSVADAEVARMRRDAKASWAG